VNDPHSISKHSGIAIAMMAALVFASTETPVARAEEAKVQCDGVNACKGTSACSTALNRCAGQNACRGQGWLPLTAAECAQAKDRAHVK